MCQIEACVKLEEHELICSVQPVIVFPNIELKRNTVKMSVTIEQQRQRVESEMTKIIDDLDRSVLRKMQADMHLCAAKCCEDKTGSIDSVQSCIERCSGPVNRAQQYVQKEMGDYQGRLQRCVMQCNDDVKLEMPSDPSESDISKYTNKFERCAIQCVDKNIEILPKLFKTIKSVLSKGPQNIPN